MDMKSSLSPEVAELAKDFGGRLLLPEVVGYDEARKVHNGLIDKRPALIARCTGTADIVKAVKFGRSHNLEIAVRGGGHNVAGRATVDNGLMIDLAPMKGIHVDAAARTARAQGGVTWAEFNRETQLHGLATTGGVISSTGIAGLTLGGGLGWLMAKHGLALDNLLSAEIVAADGQVLNASADENADLFWAIRGGGGNFGIAASLEYRLHPVGPVITGGLVAHPFEKAKQALHYFRSVTKSLPDEATVFGGLVHAPDGSGAKLAALIASHCGDLSAGAAALKPIKEFGPPVMDAIGPIAYSALNGMLDEGFPKGALNYWKSSFLAELSDSAIAAMIESFAKCPTPMGALMLEHFHGAACRVPPGQTAFPHRAIGYNLLIAAEWLDPLMTKDCIAWVRDTYEIMKPFTARGRYSNYLGDDEPADAGLAAYGENYERLRQIKAKYDPGNVFHRNQNVPPA